MALRLTAFGIRGYHTTWFQSLAKKASTPDDMNTVGALGAVFDYYG